jgi:hypothetical protein
MNRFDKHKEYSRMFKENHLTLGLFFPIESYEGSIPGSHQNITTSSK